MRWNEPPISEVAAQRLIYQHAAAASACGASMSVGSRGAISLARDTTVIDSRAVVISVVRIIQKVAALMTLRPAVQHRAHGAATNPSLRRRRQPIPRQNLYAVGSF